MYKVSIGAVVPGTFRGWKFKECNSGGCVGIFRQRNVGCLRSVVINHGQLAELARELNALIIKITLSDKKDELVWDRCDGKPSAANCYTEILHFRLKYFSKGVEFFYWKKVWLKGVPSKVSYCLWTAARNRILTHNNLQRRGFAVVSQCVLCGCAYEDTEHIFGGCDLSKQVWNYFVGGA